MLDGFSIRLNIFQPLCHSFKFNEDKIVVEVGSSRRPYAIMVETAIDSWR